LKTGLWVLNDAYIFKYCPATDISVVYANQW